MPKRPVVSGQKIIKLLGKLGYTFQSGKGSHVIYSIENPKAGYGKISVPLHDELDDGLRDGIIEAISMHTGINKEDIVNVLRKPKIKVQLLNKTKNNKQ